ncbi:hypothetical protein BB558_005475 [Smittium angustum]|uniref:beta-ketoacyl-[acyl-carrier-protein] synthase I n=1 Tax=Smittium angustum TaxID=133377 RepID=A0A2U1J0E9_SMIAN|nr:hypothetical protein BB558_005475 [Smittium angustum]
MAFNKRRIVVTGLGLVTPLGIGPMYVWNKLINAECGIRQLAPTFQNIFEDSPVKIAGIIPRKSDNLPSPDLNNEGKLDMTEWLEKGEKDRLAPFSQYAMCAAMQAVKDADLNDFNGIDKERVVSTGIGSMDDIINTNETFSGNGPNHSVSTACTTGAHSIGDAMRFIQFGDADIMLAGASEAPIHPLSFAGFNKLKALTQGYNDDPEFSSRPFDSKRSGFVIGEGAGVLEYEHAKSRNARIYAELKGYGLSGDGYHMTLPSLDGKGAYQSMSRALKRAEMQPEQVDYINAHATSTPMGDAIEMRAIESLFNINKSSDNQQLQKRISVSSTKSATGHLLGAAGAIESIFTVLAVNKNIVPPTLNLESFDSKSNLKTTKLDQFANTTNSYIISGNETGILSNPQYITAIDYIAKRAQERQINVAISNSFGFGGTNASLVFTKI